MHEHDFLLSTRGMAAGLWGVPLALLRDIARRAPDAGVSDPGPRVWGKRGTVLRPVLVPRSILRVRLWLSLAQIYGACFLSIAWFDVSLFWQYLFDPMDIPAKKYSISLKKEDA